MIDEKDESGKKVTYSFYNLDQEISNKLKSAPEKQDIKTEAVINKESQKSAKRFKSLVIFSLDIVLNLTIILGLVILIRSYLISPFEVSGSSMCDTLNYINGRCVDGNGEYIIVNKFGYLKTSFLEVGEPQRGDIVVFRPPNNGKNDFFIKRIIGLPGETVKLKDGEVYIYNQEFPDGQPVVENYLNDRNQGHTSPDPFSGQEFQVPLNNYFVMGDNRRQSNDSRHCFLQGGCRGTTTNFLPRVNIEGKAWVVLWPIWKARVIN